MGWGSHDLARVLDNEAKALSDFKKVSSEEGLYV
jgi:hypothetical protein